MMMLHLLKSSAYKECEFQRINIGIYEVLTTYEIKYTNIINEACTLKPFAYLRNILKNIE